MRRTSQPAGLGVPEGLNHSLAGKRLQEVNLALLAVNFWVYRLRPF